MAHTNLLRAFALLYGLSFFSSSAIAQDSNPKTYVQFIIMDVTSREDTRLIDESLRTLPQISMTRSDFNTRTNLCFLQDGATLDESTYRQKLTDLGFDLACFEIGTYSSETFVRLKVEDCPEAQ